MKSLLLFPFGLLLATALLSPLAFAETTNSTPAQKNQAIDSLNKLFTKSPYKGQTPDGQFGCVLVFNDVQRGRGQQAVLQLIIHNPMTHYHFAIFENGNETLDSVDSTQGLEMKQHRNGSLNTLKIALNNGAPASVEIYNQAKDRVGGTSLPTATGACVFAQPSNY
jgi:hypothetical protein